MNLTTDIITDRDTWNDNLQTLPYAHVLQTWEWGKFKRDTTGWQPHRLAFRDDDTILGMASVGIRNIGPVKMLYVPKGPATNFENETVTNAVLDALQGFAYRQRALWLKIDPDVVLGYGLPDSDEAIPHLIGERMINHLRDRGWTFSDDQVQFRNTMTLDLTQSEDDLLAQMSQNTRRKVRTATKKDVTIRDATMDDLPILYQLYQVTGARDNFLIRPFDYYQLAWRRFMEAGLAHALIAEYEGKPIAHVILFHFGTTCWYFYGASSNEERKRMPNYALQWEAMRWAKAQGYTTYDMWGAPDDFVESDPMWGVYQFKQGFRGTVTRHIGAWDYAPSNLLYRAYTQARPRVLGWMRKAR